MSARRAIPFVALVAAALARPLPAQDSPVLQEAVRLAAEGRAADARRIVDSALGRARSGEPAFVEALFTRSRVATFGDSAERDLRRIAIEFPASPWADDALLRLAQLAMAAGNPVSAFALAERLRSDYPDSDLRPRAAFWAARAAFDLGDPRVGCVLLDTARAEAVTDVEFANQVGFYRGRCTAGGQAPTATPAGAPAPAQTPAAPTPTPARAESAAARTTTPATDTVTRPAPQPPSPAAASRRAFAVQVAAARTDAEERRVLQALRRGGVEGRVVRGEDGYRRIRVGAYATEREALGAVAGLRRLVGGRPFVVLER